VPRDLCVMHSLPLPTITLASHGVGAIRRAAGELFAGNNTENLVQPRKIGGLKVRPTPYSYEAGAWVCRKSTDLSPSEADDGLAKDRQPFGVRTRYQRLMARVIGGRR
jgi:hypothetical protein